MYNFLNSNLSPKVVCKSPATDGYEVENLISDKYIERNRGFIAYPAIKPPIEIEFEFICPVNIHCIKLSTVVGSQKCSGIEIYAKNRFLNYVSICRSVFDKDGIVFCNSRKYSRSNPPDTFNEHYELVFFKSYAFRSFLDTVCIKIVIFRTEKSVPCLGSVEVWGTPSKSCSQTTIETINRLAMKSLSSVVEPAPKKLEEFEIPDDFKDDLTFEIMSAPMTLPSGKTVDQRTLEKHIQSELSFGRKPCDPFTGIKFTDRAKPVINVALKSRIDMFILQNSHRTEVAKLGRTLGRADGTSRSECNNDNNINKRKRVNSDSGLEDAISRVKQNPNFVTFTCELNNDKNICAKCQSLQNNLYKISCQHLHCKECLLLICERLQCSICDISFLRSEVKKINL